MKFLPYICLILGALSALFPKPSPVPHAPPAAVEAISAEPVTTALNTTAAERVPPPSSTVPTSQAAVVSSDISQHLQTFTNLPAAAPPPPPPAV
jgi:hypothetical protein